MNRKKIPPNWTHPEEDKGAMMQKPLTPAELAAWEAQKQIDAMEAVKVIDPDKFVYDPVSMYGEPIWISRISDTQQREAHIQSVADNGDCPTSVSVNVITYEVDKDGFKLAGVPYVEETLSFTCVPPVTLSDMQAAAEAVAETAGQGFVACEACAGRAFIPLRWPRFLAWRCSVCNGTGKRKTVA